MFRSPFRVFFTSAVVSSALLAGCSQGMNPDRRDAGGSPIIDGQFVCITADAVACLDNVHYSCTADGEFLATVQVDCDQQLVDDPPRPSVCIAETGCGLCFPNNAFCVGYDVAQCNAVGDGYDIIQTCDAEGGEVCEQGQCVNLCAEAAVERSYQGCEFYGVDLDNAALEAGRDASAQQYSVVVSNPGRFPTVVTVERNIAPLGEEPELEEIDSVVVLPGDLEIFDLPRREVDGSSSFVPCDAITTCDAAESCWCAGGLLVTDPPPEGGHRDCRCRNAAGADGLNDGTHSAITPNAYRLRSLLPIVAYQFNPLENFGVFSNDASLLLPVSALGDEYMVVGWPQTIANSTNPREDFDSSVTDEDLRAFLTIVGHVRGTQVEVVLGPSVRRVIGVDGGPDGEPGDVWTFEIGPLDVINLETGGFNADFTGTIVRANNSVAVFSGSEASDAPRFTDTANRQCCADHLEEQLFPNVSLGSHFFIGRMPPRSPALNAAFIDPTVDSVGEPNEPEYVRVVAVQEGITTVRTTLPAPDDWVELEQGQSAILYATQDFRMDVDGDRRVAVLQVLASQQAVGIPNYYPGGDPATIAVAPIAQYRREYVFLTPSLYAFDFISITAPRSAQILLDEQPIDEWDCDVAPADGIPRRIDDPPPDWVVYRCQFSFPDVLGQNLPIEDGIQNDGYHTLRSNEEVGVVVYGFDRFVSYAYSAGLNLDAIE
jgi:hypothetical protein